MSDPAPNVKRLYLHVGHAKTGTSYLQSVLWGSRQALADSGLVLPLRGPSDHFSVALGLRGGLDPELDGESAFTAEDRLVKQLRTTSAPRVLLTHEVLSAAKPHEVARFQRRLDGYEVHVVLTVRDLRRQIPAEWQQRVKTRGTVSYDDFLRGVVERTRQGQKFWFVQDTVDVAERWRGDLPPDRVHIVTTPPSGSAPTLLLERFCEVLDIDPALLDTDVSRTNESLGAQQVELMRRVNVALGDRLPHPRAGYNRVARNDFANKVLVAQRGERLDLPEHLDGWCRQEAERIIEHVRSSGYQVSGDLEDLLPASRNGPAPSHEVSEAEVAAAAVDGIAALLVQRHQDVLKLQHRRPSPGEPGQAPVPAGAAVINRLRQVPALRQGVRRARAVSYRLRRGG